MEKNRIVGGTILQYQLRNKLNQKFWVETTVAILDSKYLIYVTSVRPLFSTADKSLRTGHAKHQLLKVKTIETSHFSTLFFVEWISEKLEGEIKLVRYETRQWSSEKF